MLPWIRSQHEMGTLLGKTQVATATVTRRGGETMGRAEQEDIVS